MAKGKVKKETKKDVKNADVHNYVVSTSGKIDTENNILIESSVVDNDVVVFQAVLSWADVPPEILQVMEEELGDLEDFATSRLDKVVNYWTKQLKKLGRVNREAQKLLAKAAIDDIEEV